MSTKTIVNTGYKPERRHDYIYDNNYITSSERDHARANFKSHTSSDRIKRVPIYRTMFSEMRHFPGCQIQLEVTDPVPKFMSKTWRGYDQQARENLLRYKKCNYDPSVKVDPIHLPDPEIAGRNRYLYFRRPIMPYIQSVPPAVILATGMQGMTHVGEKTPQRVPTPTTRVAHTQTDYRDSDVQTDPYTPEYVVRPGEQPELLTLASLAYGRGLPAGLAEVEMIERARIKRAWEKTLPHLADLSQADKRRRMMDEMERQEWAVREREIEKLQEERLEVLKSLLKQREENHQDMNLKRLDIIWSKRQKVKDAKVRKIREHHVKEIRKLLAKRKNVENTYERRKLHKQYAEYESEVYAPLTRHGVFPDRNSERYVVKSRFLSSYNGLCELEASLPDFVTHPRIKAVKPQTVTKAGFIKRKYRQEMELADMHESLKALHNEVKEDAKPLRFLVRVEKPIPRPPTPAIEVPSQIDEEKELAIIYLQKIVRGRAIQNMMYEGKEKRQELIHEMRSTHALQEQEQEIKRQEKQTTMALQRQRHVHEHKEFLVDQSMSNLEGGTLGDTLDFLSKELIRLQEERRLHAYLMLAERQRRIREAEESGRRQVEERRRREADEMFKQMVKVHQDSVETYLTEVILSSSDETAHEESRKEIEEKATKINDIAYEVEQTRDDLQSEEIVADLVHCFVLPEVQKMTMREQVHAKQRKYLLAAHREVYNETQPIIDANAQRPTTDTPTSRPQSYAEREDVSQKSDSRSVEAEASDTSVSARKEESRKSEGEDSGKEDIDLEEGKDAVDVDEVEKGDDVESGTKEGNVVDVVDDVAVGGEDAQHRGTESIDVEKTDMTEASSRRESETRDGRPQSEAGKSEVDDVKDIGELVEQSDSKSEAREDGYMESGRETAVTDTDGEGGQSAVESVRDIGQEETDREGQDDERQTEPESET